MSKFEMAYSIWWTKTVKTDISLKIDITGLLGSLISNLRSKFKKRGFDMADENCENNIYELQNCYRGLFRIMDFKY